jgi:hypothetical protein
MWKEIPTRTKPLLSEFNIDFAVTEAVGNVAVKARLEAVQWFGIG